MTDAARQEQDVITATIVYHLGLEGIEVSESDARNVARHLQVIVPELRAQREE